MLEFHRILDNSYSSSTLANARRALEREVAASLGRGEKNIYDMLNRSFESALIVKALEHTGGKKIEAATLLGIGRNTLTRKIQDLHLEVDGIEKDD